MKNQTTKQKTSSSRSLYFLLALLFSISLVSCDDDDDAEPILPEPTIDKVEVGLNNNEIGVIGRDFHFNAEVLAGDKIDLVQLKIQQRAGETYSGTWSHEVTWEQYKGAKNATIHKHFDIPADAVEGKYDLLIVVTDENGTKLEEKRALTIYSPENLPVDPRLYSFSLFKNELPYYDEGKFEVQGEKLNKGDEFFTQAYISGVKGDGIMYLLFIKKSANHRPESVSKIDFSKAIVYDVFEHKDVQKVGTIGNIKFTKPSRMAPKMIIGTTALDNNVPQAPISGEKAWESGTYYFGIVYQNTTYNMSLFNYIEVEINNN